MKHVKISISILVLCLGSFVIGLHLGFNRGYLQSTFFQSTEKSFYTAFTLESLESKEIDKTKKALDTILDSWIVENKVSQVQLSKSYNNLLPIFPVFDEKQHLDLWRKTIDYRKKFPSNHPSGEVGKIINDHLDEIETILNET